MNTTLNKLEKQIRHNYNSARNDYIKAGGNPQNPSCPESAEIYKKSWLAWETAMRAISKLRTAIDEAKKADTELVQSLNQQTV